jgi:hypothetical protein
VTRVTRVTRVRTSDYIYPLQVCPRGGFSMVTWAMSTIYCTDGCRGHVSDETAPIIRTLQDCEF